MSSAWLETPFWPAAMGLPFEGLIEESPGGVPPGLLNFERSLERYSSSFTTIG
jgi:hypothetical protein